MESSNKNELMEPPQYGLKLPLNHEFPLQSKQIIIPRPKQIFEMMPLTARYFKYYVSKRLQKKRPIMDYVHMISAQRIYGCPIGGIGGGTIGRGFKGEFCRFQLNPGLYEYVTVPECQFIVNIQNDKHETIFQSVLSTYSKPKKAPQSWEWNLNGSECEYTALYPRAWTTYDLSKHGIKLICRQISPVIPHNYKDSSLPCAVFVFSAVNVCKEHRDVNITFTWTEVLAGDNKKKTLAKLDLERYSEEYTCGVTLEQRVADAPCTFTLAKRKRDTETIHESYCLWNSTRTSNYVWDCLKKNGKLHPDPSQMPNAPKVNEKTNKENKNEEKEKQKKIHKCDSIALSSTISLDPGGSDSTEFCLVWDMPIVKYKKDKKIHKRYYTKYFGSDGIAGPSIAAYALKNYKNWEKQLAEWQDPILNNSNIPDWLKSALMNELYFVADGGTIWFDVQDEYPETDPRHDFGVFGYLEGHEYRMYNTYDVHFYASFALAQLWPNLQVVLQYMFLDSITVEEKKVRKSLYDGKVVKYKIKNSIPHDLGDPADMPFTHINAYNIHDVSQWRDLNLKFILQVMRDYRLLQGHSAPFSNDRYDSMAYIDDVREGAENDLYSRSTGQEDDMDRSGEQFDYSSTEQSNTTKPNGVNDILELLYSATPEGGDEAVCGEEVGGARVWGARRYLADMYAACAALLRRARLFDRDSDGLIENSGLPDQTYDAWVMTGPSAYCGGLWVASISVVAAMARILGFEEDEKEFSKMLEEARNSFEEKLWNGSFYRFDTKPSNNNVVMADQLAGHWFLRASGWTEPVFPDVNVKKALQCIYENNVLRFMDGRMGAVNGFRAGGRTDTTALQSEEVWTGVTYAVAALMIHEGMYEQAFVTAGGLCNTLMKMGLSFETPEALYENGNHRSIAYMRPLAIWAMYQALTTRPPPAANGQVAREPL
ncbi:non-lysosomal glucosylceramidase [Aricia agestis]|uniref:non-lysosomal glucosylceramidase n=1 Tax=Aricia agestis TaxID=91739 RepID=UPI001C201BB8|nr:non-lysosomal glucosylceramidase [Aricia agestis]XP_041983734.1 non-lysosomal glucosylceramidase [Aricia agestis]XP_041983744.1 non-lysosomal glucosylceramidase [Aricia agestis]